MEKKRKSTPKSAKSYNPPPKLFSPPPGPTLHPHHHPQLKKKLRRIPKLNTSDLKTSTSNILIDDIQNLHLDLKRVNSTGKPTSRQKNKTTDRPKELRRRHFMIQTSRTLNEDKEQKFKKDKSKTRIQQLEDNIKDNIRQIEFMKSLFTSQHYERLELDSLREENGQLKSELAVLRQTNKRMEEKLNSQKDKVIKLRQDHKQQEKEFCQYEKQISKQIDQLKSQISDLKSQPKDLTKDFSTDIQPVKDLSNSDKEYLAQIKELAICRIQAIFLSSQDLLDAFDSDRLYTQEELQEALTYQPFLLNSPQSQLVQRAILRHGKGSELSRRLRSWLGSFSKIDENEEEEMVESLSEFVTEYQHELDKALQKYAESTEKISRKRLGELLGQIGLDENFIELVIRKLSLYSEELDSLSVSAFWDTFVQEKGLDFGQIDEKDELEEYEEHSMG